MNQFWSIGSELFRFKVVSFLYVRILRFWGVGNPPPKRWNLAAPIWIVFVLPVRGLAYLHGVKNRHLNLLPVIVLPVVENGDTKFVCAFFLHFFGDWILG